MVAADSISIKMELLKTGDYALFALKMAVKTHLITLI
jgi:hypothetical protein